MESEQEQLRLKWTSTRLQQSSFTCNPTVLVITQSGLKLSKFSILHNPFLFLRASFPSQVYVEQVQLLVKLWRAFLMDNLY